MGDGCQMAGTIEYLDDLGIVLVKTSGTYDLERELDTVLSALRNLELHDGNKLLFDHRDSTVIARNQSPFNRATDYAKIGLKKSTRIATVVNKISVELRLYENTCIGLGWNVEVFDDYDTALKWLAK